MLIDVSKAEHTGELIVAETKLLKIDDYSARICLSGRVSRLDAGFEFNGFLEGEIYTYCSKCLKELTIPYKQQLTQVFSNSADVMDDEVLLFEGHKADFEPVVKGIIRGGMPFSITCGEHCKGLCPVCGADRNTTECECADNYVNPAFSELKQFFDTPDHR